MAGGLFQDWLVKSPQIAFGILPAPSADRHRVIFCQGDWGWDAAIATVAATEVDSTVRGAIDVSAAIAIDATTKKAKQAIALAVQSTRDLSYNALAWVAVDATDTIQFIIAGCRFVEEQVLPANEVIDISLNLTAFNGLEQPYGGLW